MTEKGSLMGRVALVTGVSRRQGIGRGQGQRDAAGGRRGGRSGE